MNYLADTHILIWSLMNSPNLSTAAREIIEDPDNDIFFSFINVWEIALKHSLHQTSMPYTAEVFEEWCRKAGYKELQTRLYQIHVLEGLQKPSHVLQHKDPFDRMLIAQAKAEKMMLITHDMRIAQYNEPFIISV